MTACWAELCAGSLLPELPSLASGVAPTREEWPTAASDPRSLMLAVTEEYEALRARFRAPGDHNTQEIAEHARNCIRTLSQLVRSARRAEGVVRALRLLPASAPSSAAARVPIRPTRPTAGRSAAPPRLVLASRPARARCARRSATLSFFGL